MGEPHHHAPVVLLLAVISRYEEALVWTIERAASVWGPIALRSPTFAFTETDYYEATMGPGLGKTFLAFERLADPALVADWKILTGEWEAEYASLGRPDFKSTFHNLGISESEKEFLASVKAQYESEAVSRPLNLDPGYITPAKLVLAPTKDHAHRIYLGRGMYAEVTLYYKAGGWQFRDWTFPDYRRADYHAFFTEVRNYLRAASKPMLP